MGVKLSDADKRMLSGEAGQAARLAMSVMVRMADVYGAEELMDISQAHIDAVGILSESGLELAETLAEMGGRVAVPTTLNMVPIDVEHWQQWGVPEKHTDMALRQVKAYARMGCIPTCTCAPYQGYMTPRFGQQIAWAESNAIVYANSVTGSPHQPVRGLYRYLCSDHRAGTQDRPPSHREPSRTNPAASDGYQFRAAPR